MVFTLHSTLSFNSPLFNSLLSPLSVPLLSLLPPTLFLPFFSPPLLYSTLLSFGFTKFSKDSHSTSYFVLSTSYRLLLFSTPWFLVFFTSQLSVLKVLFLQVFSRSLYFRTFTPNISLGWNAQHSTYKVSGLACLGMVYGMLSIPHIQRINKISIGGSRGYPPGNS